LSHGPSALERTRHAIAFPTTPSRWSATAEATARENLFDDPAPGPSSPTSYTLHEFSRRVFAPKRTAGHEGTSGLGRNSGNNVLLPPTSLHISPDPSQPQESRTSRNIS